MKKNNTPDAKLCRPVEDALGKNESEYRTLANNLPDMVVRYDRAARLIFASENTLRGIEMVSSARRDEILGKTYRELGFPPELCEHLERAIYSAYETREPLDMEYEYQFQGNALAFNWRLIPELNKEGQVESMLGISRDITDSKQVNNMLKESEWLNKIVSELTTDYIFIADVDPSRIIKLRWMSDNISRISGRMIEDMATSDTWGSIIHPDDVVRFSGFLDQILSTAESGTLECQIYTISSEERWVQIFARPQIGEGKRVTTIVGAIRDITERKRMEEVLHASEMKFRALIEKSSDAVTLLDSAGNIVYESPSSARITGYTVEEQLGRKVVEVIHPDDRETVQNAFEKLTQTPDSSTTMEVRILHKDGSYRYLDCVATNLLDEPVVQAIVVNFHDITERKMVEITLSESETRYRILIDTSPESIALSDLTGNIILCNQHTAELYGLPDPQAVIGKNGLDWVLPEERPHLMQVLAQVITAGHIENIEHTIVRANGTIIHVENNVTLVRDTVGNPVSLIGIARDVTERKRIEDALKESERLYRQLFVGHSAMMILVDPDTGSIVNANLAAADYYGYPLEAMQLINIRQINVLPGDEVEKLMRDVRVGRQNFFITRHRLASGEERDVEVHSVPIQVEGRMLLFSIIHDITSRKQAEQKLMEAEELQRVLFNATKSTIIALFDCMGTMLTINEFGAQRIGKPINELLGFSIHDIFPKEIADARKERIDEVCRTAAIVHFEDSRQGIQYETTMYPIMDSTGKVKRVAAYARDISVRKRNEQLLRDSEQRYRALAEASHDIIFAINRDDHITYVNSYAAKQLGMQPEALIGQPRSHWFERFDAEKMGKGLKHVFETGESLYEELEIGLPLGMVYLSTWLVPLKDQSGVVDNVLGVSRDISGLRKMQNVLKESNLQLEEGIEKRTAELLDSRDRLRKLTQQIVVAQEEERRRVSRELHDEAGQALIGLRFSLETVYKELPTNLRKLRQRMVKAVALTDQTIERVRTLAYNLRPPILDLMGINLGIKELCREFSTQTGLTVEYSGADLEGLQDEASISLYRFVQEALTNAAKHASASKVQVILEYQDGMIRASVQDNGRGMPTRKGNPGLGMVGIKERFDALGGWLEVKPVSPRGTHLQVCLPWKDIVK